MLKNTILTALLVFIQSLLFAQDATGTWQSAGSSNTNFEFNIYKANDRLSGSYSRKSNSWSNLVINPLKRVVTKEDSLFIDWETANKKVSCRLKWVEKAKSYQGTLTNNNRKPKTFSIQRKKVGLNDIKKVKPQVIATKQDSIRGMITPEREWWDLTYYHLEVTVDPEKKYISGKNTIQYKVLKAYTSMQIDLQAPLKLTKAKQNGEELTILHEGNAHYIQLTAEQQIGDINAVEVFYEGNPVEAANAPWDGGFSWKKDKNGNHFIATSCQGIGASIWWPNKDHMYDEVDSMLISVTHPRGLTNISNGRLRKQERSSGKMVTSHWVVNNPINNYGVNINIGDYVNFSEVYEGEKGSLDMNYYVLRENLEKAKKHFADAPKMMKAFEHWFGPYPFYEDGYKLVEVPYLGMEHQSSVTYGNQFMNGYLGRDLSGTGWGLKFDFIIIHESGHEWFANNITYQDIADMWVHESFTNYSENLFLDYHYGAEAAAEYVIGTRKSIRNDKPIVGIYGINKRGSGDMYSKGGNMLHTLRQVINDDEKWREILRGLNKTFYHKTVKGKQVEQYISEKAGMNLEPFFTQYLRTVKIPTLEYFQLERTITYRWVNAVDGFDMPIKVMVNEEETWIYPTNSWTSQNFQSEVKEFSVDPNFYVGQLKYANLEQGKKK